MGQYVPHGSYKDTSKNIKVVLSADCKKIDGSWENACIDITNLNNADIANMDGKLENQGSAPSLPGRYIPNGSYKETSRNIKVVLYADCKKIDGSWQSTSLDITNLINADIANMDGKLENQARVIAQYFGIFDDWYGRAMAENPPFDKLNRLYIAFAWVRNGELTYEKDGDEKKIDKLVSKCRALNPSAEILISSGFDQTGNMYIEAAKDPVKFANSVVSFIQKHQLDGYDMDWENGIVKNDMNALLKEVRLKFCDTYYQLTLAVWQKPQSHNYDLPTIAKYVNQINIMSYGKDRSLESCATEYKEGGVPYHHMIGGIETEIGYPEACGHDTLSTDGTIKQKCDYALKNKLAGMMEWRLDNDFADNEKPTFKGAEAMHKYMTELLQKNLVSMIQK